MARFEPRKSGLVTAALLAALLVSLAGVARADAESAWQLPAGEGRAAALTAVRAGADGNFRVRAGSFHVRTDVSVEFALDAAHFLARFEEQFRFLFGGPAPLRKPALCVIYKDEADYRRAIGNGSRGYYLHRTRTLYTFLDGAKGEKDFATFYSPILLHEATHQLLRTSIGARDLPVWFDEGIAAYFQGWDVSLPASENLTRLRGTHYRIEQVQEAWNEERLVPLSRLIRLNRGGWAPDDWGEVTMLHYGQAASLIAYLLASEGGKKLFRRLIRAAADGSDLNAVIAKRLKKVEREWHQDLAARFGPARTAPEQGQDD